MADRILELGNYAAGYCGRLFVQAGHDVVRIEPDQPDPGWVSQAASNLFLHAGKRRLQTSDPELIAELAAKADVVIVEAHSANELETLGFDAWQAPLKVSITPFGMTGPRRNWRATPSTLLAMGGYTYVMGDSDKAPLTLPGHYVEYQSGQYAYTAASACRLADEANVIDIGMLEVIMSLSQFTTVKYHCDGEIRKRHGSDFWSVCPSNLYPCSDGFVYVNIVPTFWDSFAACLDHPELVVDERFDTNEHRMANRETLNNQVRNCFANLSRDEIQSRADMFRIPLGVVQTFSEILEDRHLAERDYWQRVIDTFGREIRVPSPGFRINVAPRPMFELKQVERPHG